MHSVKIHKTNGLEIQVEMDKTTVIVGDSNTYLLVLDR